MNPSDENDLHEFYLMTDDLELEIRSLARRAFSCPAGERSASTSRGINGRERLQISSRSLPTTILPSKCVPAASIHI